MPFLNAKKFLGAHLKQCEIETELNNRIENEMTACKRNALMKEFKKLSKRMNILVPKINEDQFNEVLADILCADYEDFHNHPVDLEYTL